MIAFSARAAMILLSASFIVFFIKIPFSLRFETRQAGIADRSGQDVKSAEIFPKTAY